MICTGATSSFKTCYWKTKSQPCKDCKVTLLTLTLSSHNLPIDRARGLFKFSIEAKHLLGSVSEKSGTSVFDPQHWSEWQHFLKQPKEKILNFRIKMINSVVNN